MYVTLKNPSNAACAPACSTRLKADWISAKYLHRNITLARGLAERIPSKEQEVPQHILLGRGRRRRLRDLRGEDGVAPDGAPHQPGDPGGVPPLRLRAHRRPGKHVAVAEVRVRRGADRERGERGQGREVTRSVLVQLVN